MPDSKVAVAIQHDRIALHLELPIDRLAMAMIQAGYIPDPGPGFRAYPSLPPEAVSRYVRDNIAIRTASAGVVRPVLEGVSWPDPGQRDLVADLAAPLPSGSGGQPVRLDYGVVIRHVIPDVAIVTLVQDWQAGVVADRPVLLGSLGEDLRSITIPRRPPDGLAALFAMMRLGVWHILEGADHLAFLLTLLLTVGLSAQERQWVPADVPGRTVRDTLWRISAFTLGHTLSLLATSLGWLPPAGRAVEVLIAVSVGVSAGNAFVPIFPRREGIVACLFGLVHGMAFASVIRSLHLSLQDTIAATLAFNVGIELVQIGLVLLTLPVLGALRRTRWEPVVRRTLAALAFACAVCWVVARLLG
ncbi:HupE/UreJ family protein [Novosphingobium sp.]|uniref:HupE/UreJ family protein n=1 Tax=Novosphingobium sp. TaxID=1874826 RepID=UPI00260B3DA3|nr:HupE/UreJ family protein [Novosphingobium sp.]